MSSGFLGMPGSFWAWASLGITLATLVFSWASYSIARAWSWWIPVMWAVTWTLCFMFSPALYYFFPLYP